MNKNMMKMIVIIKKKIKIINNRTNKSHNNNNLINSIKLMIKIKNNINLDKIKYHI